MRANLASLRKRLILKFTAKKRADGLILTMIMVFFLITFSVTIGEYYRIHSVQQDIEYQLQRSVNCAVEYAMGDAYRQDKITNLDVAEARRQFYKYLLEDAGLDGSYRKYKNGKQAYKLNFSEVSGTSNPAVFTVKGEAVTESIFSFLTGAVQIPFKISSTNYRTD